MPTINNPVIIPDKLAQETGDLLKNPGFTHNDWGNDELKEFRKVVRNFYRNEQNGFCAYCKKNLSLRTTDNCHVEHIAPKSIHKTFIFTPKNLCVVCSDCNTVKRNQEVLNEVPETILNSERRVYYPRTPGAFLIVHPHFDEYDEHITRLGPNIYIGKTNKGEFTVIACDLNRYIKDFGFPTETLNKENLYTLFNSIMDSDNFIEQGLLINQLLVLLSVSN